MRWALLGLLLVAGCGSQVRENRTTMTDARQICDIDPNAKTPDPFLITLEAMRDDGMPKIDAIEAMFQFCSDLVNAADPDIDPAIVDAAGWDCLDCTIAIVDALWS
jgi:hypothetical protein